MHLSKPRTDLQGLADKVAMCKILSEYFDFPPYNHHSIQYPHLSITVPEMCNRAAQSACYHMFGSQLGFYL
jgi:hypothetical protein